MGLPAAASVTQIRPSTDPVGALPKKDKKSISVKPPPGAGFADKTKLWWRQLSTGSQASIGIGGTLALFLAYTGYQKRKKAGSAAVAGYQERPLCPKGQLWLEAREKCVNAKAYWEDPHRVLRQLGPRR